MGQELNGSLGSWVTLSDPFPALLHGTLLVGVSQPLRCLTEGATYIRLGGHHVGHWATFLVLIRRSRV